MPTIIIPAGQNLKTKIPTSTIKGNKNEAVKKILLFKVQILEQKKFIYSKQ
jgi:hypothetical protein